MDKGIQWVGLVKGFLRDYIVAGFKAMGYETGVQPLAGTGKPHAIAFLLIGEKLIGWVPGIDIPFGAFCQLKQVHFHNVMACVEYLYALGFFGRVVVT